MTTEYYSFLIGGKEIGWRKSRLSLDEVRNVWGSRIIYDGGYFIYMKQLVIDTCYWLYIEGEQ